MIGTALAYLGFLLLYLASAKTPARGRPARPPLARRAGRAGAAAMLGLAALAWCQELGVTGGLIAWLAATSAVGTLIILAAPVAPRWVAAASVLAVMAAMIGGLRAW